MKYITCQICETAYPVLATMPLFLEGRPYTCDTCRKLAGNPRQVKKNQVKILYSWQEATGKKCSHCGTDLWFMQFQIMADREVSTVDDDITLKPGLEPITMIECPKPECPKTWRDRLLYLEHTPYYLRAPWTIYIPGIFPDFDEKVKEQDQKVVLVEARMTNKIRDPHETTKELLVEFHDRWWHEWNRRKHAPAGKGVKM